MAFTWNILFCINIGNLIILIKDIIMHCWVLGAISKDASLFFNSTEKTPFNIEIFKIACVPFITFKALVYLL